MDVATGKGLTREAVAEASARRGEPEWLRSRRLDAWDLFAAAPWPDASQDEWRRVDLTGLNMDAYRAYAPAKGSSLPAEAQPAAGTDAGGLVIQHNSEAAAVRLSEELAKQGVIFTTLDDAVQRYPELVQQHLGRAVSPDQGKFEALQAALWGGGAFLYVPRGVEVALPLSVVVWADVPDLAIFPRLLVVAEQESRVTLYEDHASPRIEGEAFSSPVAELIVGDGASVRYITLQRWGNHLREFGSRQALVGRDARLEWVTVALGARQSKVRLHGVFEGAGSETVMRGLYFPNGNEELHLDTLQDHRAPQTRSDLLFKGALRDEARAEYYGIIRVHPGAQQTNGYQQNRNLLLSDKAKAESVPILEIEANDVKCSHGATVGQVDPEQLFYLQCRGLPRPEAERMLVEAFFRSVLDAVPAESVRERVAEVVARRASAIG